MESKVKIFGHPVHPMLVVFPLGLFVTAVIFDILYLIGGNPVLPSISYYLIAAGLITGAIAAVFGFIDWLGLVTAWRGGELVYRLGVCVDRGAHINAPSSLTNESSSGKEKSGQTEPTAHR